MSGEQQSLTFDYNHLARHIPWLDSHQVKGIKWVLSRSHSYLAHAPGAGKTCEAIISGLLIPLPGTTLFIVPPTLTLNWQREAVRFSKLMGISITVSIVSRLATNWDSDFIICPDSLLSKDWVYPRLLDLKKKLIAVDEASRFKESTSQRSIAFYGGRIKKKRFKGLFQDSPYVVFLDGSPMPNRPMELWAPVYALSPRTIDNMSQADFGIKYCAGYMTEYGWNFRGSSNEEELKTRLRKDFMHVVREKELNHPERLRSIIFVNENQLKEMKTWEKRHLKNLRLNDISENLSQGDLAKHRLQLGLTKIKWVIQYVKEKLEKLESILLFAWHREVCEGLAIGLKEVNPMVIYGGVSDEKRESAFKDFNEGKRKILIGNIQSLGRGHNLQKASRVIFAEYSWTDELNRQCEKRASRRGSQKSYIRCEYIVVPDSLDEIVASALFTKEKRVKDVIG